MVNVQKSCKLVVTQTYFSSKMDRNENISPSVVVNFIYNWDSHKVFLSFSASVNGCKTFSEQIYLSIKIGHFCFSKDITESNFTFF